MSLTDLTPEQLAVVDATAPSMIVRASAGSGKTTVLVAKYIRYVTEGGMSPAEVWTVTFTRKAAAEMKRRIVAELDRLGFSAAAQQAETGPIQTLHSACERILRENSLAAGLDPEFEIIEGHVRSAMVREALRNSVADMIERSPEASRLVDHLAGVRQYGFGSPLDSALEQTVSRLTEKLRAAGLRSQEVALDYADEEAVVRLWCQEMTAEARQSWPESPEINDALSASKAAQGLAERRLGVPEWLSSFSLEDADMTSGLVQLAVATWERLEALMMERQAFDFTSLESLAVRLIEQDAGVRERLSCQVRALLVDEAQDLNPNQYRLIDSIDAPFKMLVGDFQQSIYRFRDADPRLFLERAEQWPVFPLSVNHRSNKAVLDAVDQVFGFWWGEGLNRMEPSLRAEAPPVQAIELWTVDHKDTEGLAALVRQLVDEGHTPKSITLLCRDNKAMNDHARRLSRHGVPHQVIGGSETLYTRMEVRDIGNALRALVDQEDDDAMACFLHSPFVGLSLDGVVSALADRPLSRSLPTLALENEFDQSALDKFQSWFWPLQRRAARLSVWEVLSALFAESPYFESLARDPEATQRLANVRKLLSLAIDRPELSAHDFADQIREIQKLRHREGLGETMDDEADAVTIMTIHGSKGLEFETVVVPDTFKRPQNRDRVASDPRRGLVATRYSAKSSAFQMLQESDRRQEDAEAKRLVYVAMTRARKKLCLAVGGSATPLAAAIAKALGFPDHMPKGVHIREAPGP
ncbi:MAG: UvrD-helicase domain-containing protein [Fimbriimonadaceae bacterium]|nr:UvrD-helicase domain-containing protein [Fimbriimonadaceae bacterium]QYK58294.1 MAG: UvrD-helicase domain-containing protein [Fimbriimonadaceae bacterium]